MFSGRRALRFFPTESMTVYAQLNSIMRFCLYYSIIMAVLTRNPRHIMVTALAAIGTAIVSEMAYKGRGEGYRSSDEDNSVECTKPTVDNPHMNFCAFDDRDRSQACKRWNVEDKVLMAAGEPIQDSPYQKSFDRFYTMPSTTAANDQTGFANWLYGSMPAKRSTEDKQMSITAPPKPVR